MKGRRAICVSRDEGVRRVVGGALEADGFFVEHASSVGAISADAVAVIVDRATRQAEGAALSALTLPVIVVGDDLDDDGLITLMLESPVSHHVKDPHDRDLAITSEKLATGDVFGLEKYLAPAASVQERVLATDTDKRHAVDEVCAWAESMGARRPVVHRIRGVVDELLMNALREGAEAARSSAPSIGAGAETLRGAVLRFGCDAEMLAISVGDRAGTLRQNDVMEHVRRARAERGAPKTDSVSGGAGLGLYLVLANVASLVVNVAPSKQTEVVCLFDLAKPTKSGAVSGARSLHVFQKTAS
ncbi:MAG TPA: hypothetical protein VGM90_04525 [Kofleriaceae bacterium]|jgi:hypothetical protein